MKDIQMIDLSAMSSEEMQALSEALADEASRRKRITELMKNANEAVYALFEEVRCRDIVDIIDSSTGELLVRDYRPHCTFDDDGYLGASYPQIAMRFGLRSE